MIVYHITLFFFQSIYHISQPKEVSMLKLFLTTLISLIALSSQVWALNDLSYFYKNVDGQKTNIFWYTQVTENLFFEARYDFDAPNTFGIFAGKPYGDRRLNVTPAIGILSGDYDGFSPEVYVGGGRGKFGFFSLYQYAAWTGAGSMPDWAYQWMDVTYQAHLLVKVGIGEQVYHEFTSGFSSQVDIGPTALINLGQFYLKPWYTFGSGEGNTEKLILGVGYRW